MSDPHRDRMRALEIMALLTETGATLPAVGRLLPDLLGEPDDAGRWRCIRCGVELESGERYCCTRCLARDDAEGRPWLGRRPKHRWETPS